MKLSAKQIWLAVAMSAVAACSTDGALDPSDRPDLPPAAAFDADFSFFDGRTPAPDGTTSSWQQALQTVAAARTAMAVLELPGVLLGAAAAAQPSRSGDVWTWPYSTTISGDAYHGELSSTIVGSQYDWQLYVTAPEHSPQLTNYLMARGVTAAGGFEGIWWLADVEAGTDSVIGQVSWVRNLENGTNFSFSPSDTAAWTFERSAQGNIVTQFVYNQARRRVTWYPDGSGRSWTAGSSDACWNEDLHDVAC